MNHSSDCNSTKEMMENLFGQRQQYQVPPLIRDMRGRHRIQIFEQLAGIITDHDVMLAIQEFETPAATTAAAAANTTMLPLTYGCLQNILNTWVQSGSTNVHDIFSMIAPYIAAQRIFAQQEQSKASALRIKLFIATSHYQPPAIKILDISNSIRAKKYKTWSLSKKKQLIPESMVVVEDHPVWCSLCHEQIQIAQYVALSLSRCANFMHEKCFIESSEAAGDKSTKYCPCCSNEMSTQYARFAYMRGPVAPQQQQQQ